MDVSTQRRVAFETPLDFFWIADLEGNYGLFLKVDEKFDEDKILVRFAEMSILWRNSKSQNGEIFLVLHAKENWPMFYLLCQDLILRTHTARNQQRPSVAFENALRSWQNLLSLNRSSAATT